MLRQPDVVDSELSMNSPDLEMEQATCSARIPQLAQAVAELLEELPTERDPSMLMRFYLDGTDKQQLCRELGLSPKHFDRVLMRARSRLRTIVERRAPHLALFPRVTVILLPLAMSFTFWVRHFGPW